MEPPSISYAHTHARLIVIGLLIQGTIGSQTVIVWFLKETIGIFAFNGNLFHGRVVHTKSTTVFLRILIHRLVSA